MTPDLALDRLRAANPFPAATDVDAQSLFDRITAVAQEAPARRARRRPLVVLLAAFVVVAVLASTALAISGWLGDVIGPHEVASEYAWAEKQLELPPGYDWPSLNFPSNAVTSRGAGGAFAVAIAQGAWECYWTRAIREHDAAAERRADAALADLMENHIVVAPAGASENWAPPRATVTPISTYADDGGYEYKQRMYAQARAGDAGLLAKSCRANGPG
jgi:hypothetical protein